MSCDESVRNGGESVAVHLPVFGRVAGVNPVEASMARPRPVGIRPLLRSRDVPDGPLLPQEPQRREPRALAGVLCENTEQPPGEEVV